MFRDSNNNANFDAGEVGLNGVTVQLIDAAGAVLQTATTDSTGVYTFTGLVAGDYRVRLAATNFNTGGALFGFVSSTNTPSDPDDNVNSNDDGARAAPSAAAASSRAGSSL